ncbi:MAG: hypothetical protein K5890_01130 [Bacteroidales bacterium]|jgi:hypothetical protein|nr:hypothetical protein [Bacteroidales bacterium]
MKKTLLVLAAAAMIVLGFTSCGGDKTYTELLTGQTKGWVLSAATSDPAYVFSSPTTPPSTDVYNDYLEEYEQDDIITFQENGIMTIDPGAKVVEGYGYQSATVAAWNLSSDNSTLNMQLPFFYDESGMMWDQEMESCKIVSLTSKELVIAYSFNDNESPAKGEYTFTLTYVPAK